MELHLRIATASSASEPRVAPVFAILIAECRFKDLGFTVGPNRLHNCKGQKEQPQEWSMEDQYKPCNQQHAEHIDWIADLRINPAC